MNAIFLQLIRFKYRSLRPIIICDLQFHTGQIQRIPNCKLSFCRYCKHGKPRCFSGCYRNTYRNFFSKIIEYHRGILRLQRTCFIIGETTVNIYITSTYRGKKAGA